MATAMRRLIFSLLCALFVTTASAQTDVVTTTDSVSVDSVYAMSRWMKRIERYNRFWHALIPDGARLQVAGNMGAASVGPVWIYGRNRQWETALTLGYVPKHQGNNALVTMTIKEDFIPWTISLGNNVCDFQPLATGVYLNTVFSSKFWTHQPHRYPKGYYWFSTRVRPNLYLGERLRFRIPDHHRKFSHQIKLFYELSTCDFYLIQAVKNDYITPAKILTLSLGVQLEWM